MRDIGKDGGAAGRAEMSADTDETIFQTGEIEREFAGRLISRGGAAFAGRRTARAEKGPAARIKKQTERGFAGRTRKRYRKALAERIQNGGSALFATRILGRCPVFETEGFHGTPLIHKKPQTAGHNSNIVQQAIIRFRATWNHRMISEQRRRLCRDALPKNVVMHLERYLRGAQAWHGTVPAQKELTVFRDIATIFVNRGSRPDLAKKAERELVKILSREFLENNPDRRSGTQTLYQKKKRQEEAVVTKKTVRAEETVMTKRTVMALEEQVKQQQTLLTELNRKVETIVKPQIWDVGKLTGEVMKRMETEMHLERLRRGI